MSGGATYVCALAVELHLPQARSLKAKRATLRPIVEGLRHRHRLSVAETDHHDVWQRATIGVAAVSGSERGVTDQLDDAERFVWSHPEIEVLTATRHWLEVDLP
ncbi:MAG: DUF503 domain-containing protein [Actinomycetota bacterium]|nr:DUF503 domain-containing protein [Actinomycetota bacterium]